MPATMSFLILDVKIYSYTTGSLPLNCRLQLDCRRNLKKILSRHAARMRDHVLTSRAKELSRSAHQQRWSFI